LELEVYAKGGEVRRFEALLGVLGESLGVEREDGQEGLLIANVTAPALWLLAVDVRPECLERGWDAGGEMLFPQFESSFIICPSVLTSFGMKIWY
jgi:hypothetical protein